MKRKRNLEHRASVIHFSHHHYEKGHSPLRGLTTRSGYLSYRPTGLLYEERPVGVNEDCAKAQNEERAALVEEFNGLGRAHFLHASLNLSPRQWAAYLSPGVEAR